MSKYIAFAAIALMSLTAFTAAEETVQDDPKSKAILDKLIAKGKSYKTFTASFTNRFESKADGIDQKKEGYVMAKGKKFKLTMDEYTIFCNGETVWTYSEESNEVTITDPSELSEEELDPSKMLTMFETGFKSKYIEEKPVGGVDCEILKLFPVDAGSKAYHTVVLSVDKAKVQPKDIRIMYKDGNEVSYTLKKFTADTPIADEIFTFPVNRYPGVEVIDMR